MNIKSKNILKYKKHKYCEYLIKTFEFNITFKMLNLILQKENLKTISFTTYSKIRAKLKINTRNSNTWNFFENYHYKEFLDWIKCKK